MKRGSSMQLRPIGVIRSTIKEAERSSQTRIRGARPDVWLDIKAVSPFRVLDGLLAGQEIIVVTWLHKARRDVLKVHPRSDPSRQLMGVVCDAGLPDRPNPLGLHQVTIREGLQSIAYELVPWRQSTARRVVGRETCALPVTRSISRGGLCELGHHQLSTPPLPRPR